MSINIHLHIFLNYLTDSCSFNTVFPDQIHQKKLYFTSKNPLTRIRIICALNSFIFILIISLSETESKAFPLSKPPSPF